MDDVKPSNSTASPNQPETGQARGPVSQYMNYDKLASDRIGEELNRNATIWKLYTEEAKEYDIEFTRERNENLNNMLLFATLFSAIVTAFIIESTNLLEQDSSEVSTQLLLMLVQSQQRIETGTPNITSTSTEIPDFIPSPTARVINVLWFVSLMISLGAAVVAILAKEWLTAFTTNRTRDAHKYALERQARHADLEAWKMLLIIDLLPTFLNFALFIFGLGLIIRLWLLDVVVAGVMTGVSAVLCAIYLFFVITGALYKTCPYKSRLSAYMRESVTYIWEIVQTILKCFVSIGSTSPDTHGDDKPNDEKVVILEEIALLSWLFSYSSDPVLETYVTQALAGLTSLKLQRPTFLEDIKSEVHGSYVEKKEILAPVFYLGAQAVAQLQRAPSKGRTELELCGGTNAARLALAVAEIYPHALTWQICSPQEAAQVRESNREELSHSDVPEPATLSSTPTINMSSVCKLTDNVFDALDLVWAETSPALTLTAYAYLLTAELKMVKYALTFLSLKNKPTGSLDHTSIDMATSNNHPELPGSNQGGLMKSWYHTLSRNVPVIQNSLFKVAGHFMTLPDSRTEANEAGPSDRQGEMAAMIDGYANLPGQDLDGLRKRYSLALTRTALVIKASHDHLTSKGSQELQSAITTLLSEAMELVKQEKPKPGNDTHRFGTNDWHDFQEVSITVAAESRKTQTFICEAHALGYDLVEGLVKLCDIGTDTPLIEGFRVAAFNLLLTYWPAFLEQRSLDSISLGLSFSKVHAWGVQQWEMVPLQTTPSDSQTTAEVLIYQTMVLASIASALALWRDSHWVLKACDGKDWESTLELTLSILVPRSKILLKLTERLRSHANNEDNIYCKWLPTEITLGDWITLIYQHLVDPDTSNTRLSAARRLSWCISSLIKAMGQLPNCSVEGHSHSGVLTQWISSHSITVPAQSDTAPENLRPRIDQVMEFIYAASQATDRDHTTGVISTLLYQVKTHIESANCHECLHYFTQEKGFEILVKIGLNESDRIAVVRMASQVIVGLCTAQLSTNAEALPSLLKVLCNICDYEYDRYYDIDDFLRGARFQMEQLSTTISPSTFFLVQKLISQLNTWAPEWENWLEHAQNISAFRDQIQRWAEPNASGHSPPESGDREPSGVAILNSISSVNVSPRDSAPGDSPPETRSTDLGSQTLSTEGAIVAELVVESAPTHDEEQPVDKSEEN